MVENLKIASLNCRGLADRVKRFDVFHYLKEIKCDIYCLQDIHWDENLVKKVEREWNGKCFISSGSSNSRGVSILFNRDCRYNVKKVELDHQGNLIGINFEIDKLDIFLVSLYGPNEDNPKFYQFLLELCAKMESSFFILVGDWNLLLDIKMDSHNYININNPKARQCVLDMIHVLGLKDEWRARNPSKLRYTWRRKNPIKMARLDFFLISEELTNFVDSCKILPGYRSDHSIITISFKFVCNIRGRGYWKLNNSLLQEEDYKDIVKDCINKCISDYACPAYDRTNLNTISRNDIQFTVNDQLFFETLLLSIRGATISYSSYITKLKKKREQEILQAISTLEINIGLSPDNQELHNQLDNFKAQLHDLRLEKLKGAMIRSRVQLVEENEKPSSYFLNLEKRRFINKQITFLESNEGHTLTEKDDILEYVFDFIRIYIAMIYHCRFH